MASPAPRRESDAPDSDFRKERTKWQTASLFASRNWLGALVILISAGSLVGVLHIISENQKTLKAQCDRGNVTRPQQIDTYLDIAAGNRDRAAAWVKVGEAFPPTAAVADLQHDANLSEARRLERDANALADAQRSVSLYPDAKNPERRALVDCAEQFG